MTKEFLSDRGVQFETRDTLVDPTAKKELQALIGASTNEEMLALGLVTPVTVVGGKIISFGYKAPELAAAFGVRGLEAAQHSPQWWLTKIELLLPALVRASRQIPDDRLDWNAPYDKTTIRKLMTHMLVRLMKCPEAEISGSQSGQGSGSDSEPIFFNTSEEMARYGESVLHCMRSWLGGNCNLQKEVHTFKDGDTTVGYMLSLVVGHLIHHVRQIYQYMDMMGITPKNPIGEKEFDGVLYPLEI